MIWENYCIPVATTVYGNVWSVTRDPDVFPEADAFKPRRWIDGQGSLRDDNKLFVFGFGRGQALSFEYSLSLSLSAYALVNLTQAGKIFCMQAVFQIHFCWYRSVFTTAVLILWAFKLTLDPTKPLEGMKLMGRSMLGVRPREFEFEKRIPETELRRMMQDCPEVA